MGELAASLSHEITQPIASARNNARAAQNFLDRQPPDFGEVREALDCVVGDIDRAGDIVDRIRDHIKKTPPRKERIDINQAVIDVIALAQGAIGRNRSLGPNPVCRGITSCSGGSCSSTAGRFELDLKCYRSNELRQEGPTRVGDHY